MGKSNSKKLKSLCSLEGLGAATPYDQVEIQGSRGGVEGGRLKRLAEEPLTSG